MNSWSLAGGTKLRRLLYIRRDNAILEINLTKALMHQSFVSPVPVGPGNSGAFNFSIFKALLKALW